MRKMTPYDEHTETEQRNFKKLVVTRKSLKYYFDELNGPSVNDACFDSAPFPLSNPLEGENIFDGFFLVCRMSSFHSLTMMYGSSLMIVCRVYLASKFVNFKQCQSSDLENKRTSQI